MGMCPNSNDLKQLPSQQLLSTANEVAKSFRDLTKQLNTDLTLRDVKKCRFTTRNKAEMEPKKQKPYTYRNGSTGCCQKNQKQNVCFTVDVQTDVQKKSKPVLSARQKKVLTIEEIEEKQRKAEERRNVCKQTHNVL